MNEAVPSLEGKLIKNEKNDTTNFAQQNKQEVHTTTRVYMWYIHSSVPDRRISDVFGPLQCRHPLVIVTKEGGVQVGATGETLTAHGNLAQEPACRFRLPPVPGVSDGLLELHVQCPGTPVVRHRTHIRGERVGDRDSEVIRVILVHLQKVFGCVLEHGLKLRGLDVIDSYQRRLGHGIRGLVRYNVFTGEF